MCMWHVYVSCACVRSVHAHAVVLHMLRSRGEASRESKGEQGRAGESKGGRGRAGEGGGAVNGAVNESK